MITYQSHPIRVISADCALREATIQWCPGGKARVVSMLQLRGTVGGQLEVAQVCRQAEKVAKAVEQTKGNVCKQ